MPSPIYLYKRNKDFAARKREKPVLNLEALDNLYRQIKADRNVYDEMLFADDVNGLGASALFGGSIGSCFVFTTICWLLVLISDFIESLPNLTIRFSDLPLYMSPPVALVILTIGILIVQQSYLMQRYYLTPSRFHALVQKGSVRDGVIFDIRPTNKPSKMQIFYRFSTPDDRALEGFYIASASRSKSLKQGDSVRVLHIYDTIHILL